MGMVVHKYFWGSIITFILLFSTSPAFSYDPPGYGVYLYDLNGNKDPVPYLKKEAKNGGRVSQRLLARKLSRMGSMTSESLKWYLASAKKGDLYSMISLGRANVCKVLNKCSPDDGKWYEYFEKVAKDRAQNKDKKAMRALSYYYGLIGDDSKKSDWLKKSAEAGDARAQYDLAGEINKGAGFYWTDSGRNEDIEKWYKKSYSNGFYPAKLMLGDFYNSIGDAEESNKLISDSFNDGYKEAFIKVYLCKSGFSLRDRASYCGSIKKDKADAWGTLLYMNDYGVRVEKRTEDQKHFTDEEKEEGEKYYQELKAKIPRLFGQRVVY